jgi:hypothetical protein
MAGPPKHGGGFWNFGPGWNRTGNSLGVISGPRLKGTCLNKNGKLRGLILQLKVSGLLEQNDRKYVFEKACGSDLCKFNG